MQATVTEPEVLIHVIIVLSSMLCLGWALLGIWFNIAPRATLLFCTGNMAILIAKLLSFMRPGDQTLYDYFQQASLTDVLEFIAILYVRAGLRQLHGLYCTRMRTLLFIALSVAVFMLGAQHMGMHNLLGIGFFIATGGLSWLTFSESNQALSADFPRATRWLLLGPLLIISALFFLRAIDEVLGMLQLRGDNYQPMKVQHFPWFIWLSLMLFICLNASLIGLTLNDLIKKLNHSISKLNDNAKRLQHILDTAPVGVAISVKGKIRFTNPKVTQLLNMKVGDPSSSVLVSDADRAKIVSKLKTHHHINNMELQMYCPHGMPRDLLVTYLPIDYHGEAGILGWMIDVTDTKKASLAIRQANDEQTAIFDAATLGIAFIKNGKIVRINRMLEELFACPPGEMVGQSPTVWWGESKLNDDDPYAEIERGATHTSTQQLKKRDGSRFWCRISGSAIDCSDLSRGTVWMFDDVTPEREAIQLMRQAKELAEDATRLKSNFLANMSHEIRTPMNAIIGMSHLALKTELNPKQRHYIEKVDGAAQNLLVIINDILDFSKIEAGKLHFETTDFHLDDVLENLSDVVSIKAQDKGLELLFEVEPQVPLYLIGDPLRLGQVLLNLVSNAIKFTEHGEITLSIKLARSEHKPPAPMANHVGLRFEVSDTGMGLSQEHSNKLFSAFSQADVSITRKYGGTGLGLSICKRLVELMQGEIGVTSEPGKGSTFYFTARFELQAQQVAKPGPEPDMTGLRILVVDDNARAREILQNMLAVQQFHADVAKSGAEALSLLRQAQQAGQAYGLVLMDWMMPEQDGLAAIEHIRADPELGNTPAFVMVTAHSRDELLEQADGHKIDGLLIKPISPSSLLDGILSALGKEVVTRGRKHQRQAANREATQSLQGAYLLLVEDNLVNQELALEILQDAGICVDVANNGMEALAMLHKADYDGVLMDCQMPVMDGYEATRQIRAEERFATLPVIAMTANAMRGDRALCLAAGMNDHVSKPINVDHLFATLARWVSPGHQLHQSAPDEDAKLTGQLTGQPAEHVEQAEPIAQSLSDTDLNALTRLNMPLALRNMGGNSTLMRKLLKRFTETRLEAMAHIQSAIEQKDFVSAIREAHSIKGLAGNIGASQLQTLANQLETAFKHGSGFAPALEAMAKELEIVTGQISKVLHLPAQAGAGGAESEPEPTTTAAAPQIDHAALAEQLQQLASLLANDDPRSAKLAEAMAPSMRSLGQNMGWNQLIKLIGKYEFEAAHEKLSSLISSLTSAPGTSISPTETENE